MSDIVLPLIRRTRYFPINPRAMTSVGRSKKSRFRSLARIRKRYNKHHCAASWRRARETEIPADTAARRSAIANATIIGAKNTNVPIITAKEIRPMASPISFSAVYSSMNDPASADCSNTNGSTLVPRTGCAVYAYVSAITTPKGEPAAKRATQPETANVMCVVVEYRFVNPEKELLYTMRKRRMHRSVTLKITPSDA